MPIQTRVENHTIHITGYVSSDAYEPLKEALSQVSDRIVLSFDEKCFINSTGFAILFDLILPIKEKVRIVHPSAHFRKVFDIVGLSRDVEVLEGVPA